jgi:hypothetical protein
LELKRFRGAFFNLQNGREPGVERFEELKKREKSSKIYKIGEEEVIA